MKHSKFAAFALLVGLLVGAMSLTSCTPANRQKAVNSAMAQVGRPYVYGGNSVKAGFDCSGLTSWAWGTAGVSLPRTAAGQYQATQRISKSQLQLGDLVFFGSGRVTHVAMYIGGGKMVQARKVGTRLEVVSVDWWASNRIGYGRVKV